MKSKISSTEWKILYFSTGLIDLIQFLIDFTGVGDVINEVADEIIAPILGGYFFFRGAMDMKSFLVLLGIDIGEEMTAAAAPLWILDVWYTNRRVSAQKAEYEAATAGIQIANQSGGPVNQDGVRQPDNAGQKPLNIRENGESLRPPNPLPN